MFKSGVYDETVFREPDKDGLSTVQYCGTQPDVGRLQSLQRMSLANAKVRHRAEWTVLDFGAIEGVEMIQYIIRLPDFWS
jgi:hypothetical protein